LQLAHFPGGTPGQSAIERDDFPGPSFSVSLLEDRKRRLSGSGIALGQLRPSFSVSLLDDRKLRLSGLGMALGQTRFSFSVSLLEDR
jgi:hypothetical protein